MEHQTNRVLHAFQLWEQKQQQLSQIVLPGKTGERLLARQKLNHLQHARHRIRQDVRAGERSFMPLLDEHINRLEKQVYPQFLVRLYFRVKDALYDGPKNLKQQELQRQTDIAAVRQQVKAAGFGDFHADLEKQLSPDQTKAVIPLATRLDDRRTMQISLQFNRDDHDRFNLSHIHAGIKDRERPNQRQEHLFQLNEWPELNAGKIKNLLEGRPIRQNFTDMTGTPNSRWVDLGRSGRQTAVLTPQYYPDDFSGRLNAVIEQLPVTIQKSDLLKSLERGQLIGTHWRESGKQTPVFLQADAKLNDIRMYDQAMNPTTRESVKEQLKQTTGPKEAKIKQLVKKPDTKHQQQRKSRKIGS